MSETFRVCAVSVAKVITHRGYGTNMKKRKTMISE